MIVAGTRSFTDKEFVRNAIAGSGLAITEIVHGGAKGVDSIAHDLAEGIVPIKVFPVDRAKHGRAAGPIRNREMADYADALIAIWNGTSRGTLDMIRAMDSKGKFVQVHFVDTVAELIGEPKLPWYGKIPALVMPAKDPCPESCTTSRP